MRSQRFDHPAVVRAKKLDFSGFLHHPGTGGSLQAAPFASYVTDAGGMMRAGLFIRLEQLERDLVPLAAHLGFAPVLPMANQSERARDWRPYYSDIDATTLARICASDITQFGYTFDPVPGLFPISTQS